MSATSKDIKVGAENLSSQWWLEGVVNNVTPTLYINGQTIPITSSRAGIIMLADGYPGVVKLSDGSVQDAPPAHRQAILMHEARHSDCTGGLSENEIQMMRDAQSYDDFLSQVKLPHCGHLHAICPSGTYQGLAACDVERFGAYTVGMIYEASMINAQTNEIDRKALQISALDSKSRFLGSAANSLDEQTPNMTSDGVRN